MIKRIWITPEAEPLIGHIARVSNPANQDNPSVAGLIKYMIRHQHWSPFEMVSACYEINTTRDIGRQILRHRSFSFQEFSFRYQSIDALPPAEMRECRLQDKQNRQNSLPCSDQLLADYWNDSQLDVYEAALRAYQHALSLGIAKEQARALLPEGLTPSRMYMAGTLRSWIHYVRLRSGDDTQKEHRLIARAIGADLAAALPAVWQALQESQS